MGAAASVKLIYSEAVAWFKQYFDGVTYIEDFRELDKNGDGGITFEELQAWLREKAKDNESWRVLVTHPTIFKTAHIFSSKQHAVPPGEFSILWVHFKHADEWNEGNDVGNEKLTYEEFRMACRTFISAQANESLSDERILSDFTLLDVDKSGSVEFIEVCTYCSKFVDTDFAEQFITASTPASLRRSYMDFGEETLPPRSDVDKGGANAVNEMLKEMEKNERIAHFEEIKINTELALGVV